MKSIKTKHILAWHWRGVLFAIWVGLSIGGFLRLSLRREIEGTAKGKGKWLAYNHGVAGMCCVEQECIDGDHRSPIRDEAENCEGSGGGGVLVTDGVNREAL